MSETALKGMLTEEEFLQHMNFDPENATDEELAHYGKKGMKWGQRMAEVNLGAAARSRNVRKSGVAGKQTKEERSAAIDAARGRIATGQNKRDLKTAKATYKLAKKTDGKAAAKEALRAVKDKNADDYHDSQLAKNGAEMTKAVVATVALSALSIALAARS